MNERPQAGNPGEADPADVWRALAGRTRRTILVLADGPKTIRELSESLGIERQTAQEYVTFLRHKGLVESRGPQTSKYKRHRLVRSAFGWAIDWLLAVADTRDDARDLGLAGQRDDGATERLAAGISGGSGG